MVIHIKFTSMLIEGIISLTRVRSRRARPLPTHVLRPRTLTLSTSCEWRMSIYIVHKIH